MSDNEDQESLNGDGGDEVERVEGEAQDDDDSDYGGSSKKKKRGKKRKAKDSKKGSKKKKKRKAGGDSDASEPEFDASATATPEEEDYTPKRSKGRPPKNKETPASAAAPATAATPAASDDKPSVAEVCDNFGLNDVDLEYTDADYQNLTTYKLFQSTYKQRIQGANPKVPQPKLMMLVAAKWREFQTSSPDIQEVTAAREGPSKKIVSTQHGMGPHSVLRSKQMRASDAQSAKMSEDKAAGSTPARTGLSKAAGDDCKITAIVRARKVTEARALRSVDKKLLTPAKMFVPSRSKSSTEPEDEAVRNIRAMGSKIGSTMVAELRTSSSATAPATSRESRSRSASEDRASTRGSSTASNAVASTSGSSSVVPEGKRKRGRPSKTGIQEKKLPVKWAQRTSATSRSQPSKSASATPSPRRGRSRSRQGTSPTLVDSSEEEDETSSPLGNRAKRRRLLQVSLDDSKTPTIDDMKSLLKDVKVSSARLSAQDIGGHTGQSSGNSTSIDDDADTDIEDTDGPSRCQPSTSGSTSMPSSAKDSRVERQVGEATPRKGGGGRRRKNEGEFACDTVDCGYRTKYRFNLKVHCKKLSHHASCLSPDKGESEKMDEGREEPTVKAKDEPGALEECVACGKSWSSGDFVKKLKESAIRNLKNIPNVDKVVAAKQMCRSCFLGKRGNVTAVERGQSSSKPAQASVALTKKKKVESADQENAPVKEEIASTATEGEMEGDFDSCLESHDKDFEEKERRIKALSQKCDGLAADLERMRKELAVKNGKLTELNFSLEEKDQFVLDLSHKCDSFVASAEKMQAELRAQAQEEIDTKEQRVTELRQQNEALEAAVQKMKNDGTDLKRKILNANELVRKNGSLEAEVERLRKNLSTKDEKVQHLEGQVKSSCQSTDEQDTKLRVACERAVTAENAVKRVEGRWQAVVNESDEKLNAANDRIKKLEEIKELKIKNLKHAEEAIRRADDNMKKEIKSKMDTISELESRCKKLEDIKNSINEDKCKELAAKDAVISDLRAKGSTSSDRSSQSLKDKDDQISELKSRCRKLEDDKTASSEAKERELTEKHIEILNLRAKCSEFKETSEKRSEETEKLRERQRVIDETWKTKLEGKDGQISDLMSKCRQLEDEKKAASEDKGKDLTAKSNEISDLRAKLAEVQAASEERLVEKEKLKETLKGLENALAAKGNQIAEYEKRCNQLEENAKASGESKTRAMIAKDKEISNLKVKCKEQKAVSDDKSEECKKLKNEKEDALKEAKERREAEKQAKAEKTQGEKALETLKSETEEKVRRLEEAIAVKDKDVEATRRSSEEEKLRAKSSILELEEKLKTLAEKSKTVDDDKKAATASLEEKLKSMSRQKTTAEQELAKTKDALAKSQEALERNKKEREDTIANQGKESKEEVAKMREDLASANRKTEEARKDSEEAKVLINRAKFAENEAMREKDILAAKVRELKEKGNACKCPGSDAPGLTVKERTYLSLLSEKPKLLETIDKKEKEIDSVKKGKEEMRKNLMKIVTSRNDAFGKKSKELIAEKKVSGERAELLAEKEKQLAGVITKTEATIDGLQRDLEESKRGAAKLGESWTAAKAECAKVKLLLNVAEMDEVVVKIKEKDENIRRLESGLEQECQSAKRVGEEAVELKLQNKNMVTKFLANVKSAKSVIEAFEDADNETTKQLIEKINKSIQRLEHEKTYESFDAFTDELMTDALQIAQEFRSTMEKERKSVKHAENEIGKLRAEHKGSEEKLLARVKSVIETFEDSQPIQNVKKAMQVEKDLISFECSVAHTMDLFGAMTRALQTAQDKAKKLDKVPVPPPPQGEEQLDKIRELEQSVATNQSALKTQIELAEELRLKLSRQEEQAVARIAELEEENRELGSAVINNKPISDDQKAREQVKSKEKAIADPEATADAAAYLPFLRDLERFEELYDAFEDLSEDIGDIFGLEEGLRENGRTFVSGVMEEDGVDEERARRILKKAFALRFKVAMPEFDL